jgi:hypothetical protein
VETSTKTGQHPMPEAVTAVDTVSSFLEQDVRRVFLCQNDK